VPLWHIDEGSQQETGRGPTTAHPPVENTSRKDGSMSNRNSSTAVCESRGPCLPSGAQIGVYEEENGVLIWERRIKRKHILRFLDGLTVNAGLLRQVRNTDTQVIRYTLDDDGVYEIPLSVFLERCSILQEFAGGEDVYALPRSEWRYTPQLAPLGLFGFEGRA
jgi:hypothetical protein